MRSRQSPFSRGNGFTLVELLIVVAIVGVLATIGIPTYQRMVKKARQAEAKSNLGSIGRLIQAEVALRQAEGRSPPSTTNEGLTLRDYSSPTSCVIANSIGFEVSSCSALRYNYQLLGDAGAATEQMDPPCPSRRGKVSNQDCTLRDTWIIKEGRLIHLLDSLSNCDGDVGTEIAKNWGPNASGLDLDRDNDVDSADLLDLMGLDIWDSCP